MGASVLAIDAGNTNCKAALFVGGRIAARFVWPSAGEPPPFPAGAAGSLVAVSSVNPRAGDRIRVWAAAAGGTALYIPEDIGYPIAVSVDEPGKVGPDRVLAAAAALHALRSPCVVVCAGTATTVDVASPHGGFLGGSIMPGPQLMARALSAWTSLLPCVEPSMDATYPGRDTRGAIDAGVAIGAIGAVKELVSRAVEELPGAGVALTGGNAGFFKAGLPSVSLHDENLVLRGVLIAAAKAL